jgi:hypothetical protein
MHRLVAFAFLAARATWPMYAQDQTRGGVGGVKDHGTQEMFLPGRQWDSLDQKGSD